MTGSVALDVVIGLVFIYLLYSLFATILMEIISNWLGLRARNLKYSIKRMLVDDEYGKGFKSWKLPAYFLGIYMTLRDFIGAHGKTDKKDLFLKFFEQPSIKYLSNGGMFSKPSYLTSANFSKALLDSLKKDQVGNTNLEKIQNGIGALVSKETKEHIQSLLDDANNDLQKFKVHLESWFDDTQERSIGWFKRNNQIWLLIIGLFMAVTFDASTFKIAKTLATDEEARAQLVAIASDYVNENKELKTAEDSASYENNLKVLKEQKEELIGQLDNAHDILGANTINYNLTLNPKSLIASFGVFWDALKKDFWGYFITALAISLGAPFWFDLLNKLIKLRGSVQQPARSTSEKPSAAKTDQSTLDRVG